MRVATDVAATAICFFKPALCALPGTRPMMPSSCDRPPKVGQGYVPSKTQRQTRAEKCGGCIIRSDLCPFRAQVWNRNLWGVRRLVKGRKKSYSRNTLLRCICSWRWLFCLRRCTRGAKNSAFPLGLSFSASIFILRALRYNGLTLSASKPEHATCRAVRKPRVCSGT